MYSTNFRFWVSMYESFSSRGRLGSWKGERRLEDVISREVVVGMVAVGAEKGERIEERNVDCGSKGPMGGRENFWSRDWA
jgi:hypothetical protein